jgi:hypothetical protein
VTRLTLKAQGKLRRAANRITHVNAAAPMQNEGRLAEPKSYADS